MKSTRQPETAQAANNVIDIDPTSDRDRAPAQLFYELAFAAKALVKLLEDGGRVDTNEESARAAMIAGAVLAGTIGLIADRAFVAMSPEEAPQRDADSWVFGEDTSYWLRALAGRATVAEHDGAFQTQLAGIARGASAASSGPQAPRSRAA